jgi:LysM repeat protein
LTTFHDENVHDTHSATIDWGDGTKDAGVITKPLPVTSTVTVSLPTVFEGPSDTTPPPAPSPPGSDGAVSGSHVYADNGDYTVTVCVTDSEGDTGCDTQDVKVHNVAPSVDAGPDQTAYLSEAVTVSGTWTDPSGSLDNPYGWWWDLDGQSGADLSGTASYGETISGTTSFALSGSYTLTLSVRDKDGGSGRDSLVIEVLDQPPPVVILGYHTVVPGECLYCIARAYEVDPYAIAAQNGIVNIHLIYSGQILAIPNMPGTLPAGRVSRRQF